MLAPVRETFRAVAKAVVPESASLDAGAWLEVEATVEAALATRPEAMRQQLVLFLRLVEYLPLVRHLRPFTRLSLQAQTAFLHGIEGSRHLKLRRGMWGVRTLVFMGYYTRDDVQGALGYRAHHDGWSARRTTAEMRAAAAEPFGEESDVPHA